MTARRPIVLTSGQLEQLQNGDTLLLPACATANASMNCPHGTAPSSPTNGDLWTTTAGLFARINGATVGPFGDFSGPGSSTADHFVTFNGTTGKAGKDSGLALDTDVALAANSDSNIPSQKAVKSYADAGVATALVSAQSYTDAKVQGLSWKTAVRLATTANGALATAYANGQTIDGVTLATGDRILLKDQTTGAENGIYTVNASGAPTRATDANAAAKIIQASCYIEEGTTNADTLWTCTTNAPITLDTTALAFAQLSSGVGGITQLTGDVTAGPGSGSQAATISNNTVTYAKMQDVSATSRILGRKTAGAGDTEECTLSQVLDFIGSAAQGDILYRGASAWSRLAAGTATYLLQTNGASADPSWVAPPAGASAITIGSGGPGTLSKPDGSLYSRSDLPELYENVPSSLKTGTVQVTSAHGSGSPAAMVLPGAPTVGNLILAACAANASMSASLDTSKWFLIDSGGSGIGQIIVAGRYVQGGDTATLPNLFTGGVSTFHAQQAIEISGLTGTWAEDFDRVGHSFGATGSGTFPTASTATRVEGALAYAFLFNYDGGSNITGGSPYTFDQQGNNNSDYGAWAIARAPYDDAGSNPSATFNVPDTTHAMGHITVYLSAVNDWKPVRGLPKIGTYKVLTNLNAYADYPTGKSLSDLIDAAIGSTRGSILRRGANGWEIVPPGLNTYVLTSNGSGADPTYQAIPGSGGAGTPPTIVQSAISSANSASITLGAAPTNGNLLVCMWGNPTTPSVGTGWTLQSQNSSSTDWFTVCTKVAGAGESATQTPIASAPSAAIIMMWEIHGQNATTPILFVSAGGPVTTNVAQGPQFPALANVLNLGAIDIMGASGSVSQIYNMTQDQIVSTGNRRGVGAHSDGSKSLAQLVALLSTSLNNKVGLICITT